MQLQRPLNLSKVVENGGVWAKPIFIKDTMYVGSADTYFYAIDAKTGIKKWNMKTGGIIATTAVYDDEAIYFGCFDTHLYAISPEGNVLWKFKTNGLIASSPIIHDNVIYFGSSDYNFYAVDLKTHKKLWHFRTNDEIVSDPIIVNNRIYFGSMDSYLYCLDFNGNLLWKFKTNAAILIGKAAYDIDTIYFGSADERLYAVDFEGNLKWYFRTAEEVYNTAIVHKGKVYFNSRDRHSYCLNAKTGACIWKYRTEIDMMCPPVIYKNRIFFAGEELYALNMNGYLVWKSQLDIFLGMNLAVWKDSIIFGAIDCKIRSVSFDGQLAWEFQVNGVMAPIESYQVVQNPPKWNPHLFEPEVVKKAVSFNPYAVSALTNEKIYGGINTTGIEAYIGVPRDIGAYREAGMESANMYKPDKKKKKTREEELLEQQSKEQWGI